MMIDSDGDIHLNAGRDHPIVFDSKGNPTTLVLLPDEILEFDPSGLLRVVKKGSRKRFCVILK